MYTDTRELTDGFVVPDHVPDLAAMLEAELAAFHDKQLRRLLDTDNDVDTAAAATAYITWLDACRNDAIDIRDVAVHRAYNKDPQLGYGRLATAMGLNRARASQIVNRAKMTHAAAATRLAALRRRLARSG